MCTLHESNRTCEESCTQWTEKKQRQECNFTEELLVFIKSAFHTKYKLNIEWLQVDVEKI